LMADLVSRQIESLSLVLGKESPATILVDGGFSKNDLFMKMMAAALPGKKVHASEVAQATALGAALVLHEKWNETSINKKLIKLVTY